MSPYLSQNYDLLKKKVEENVNERCFYGWEIARILYHLGLKEFQESSIKGKVNRELRKSKLDLFELGIKVKGRGIRQRKVGIYRESEVFEYLQGLEIHGQIELPYENMHEIIEEKLHIRPIENELIF